MFKIRTLNNIAAVGLQRLTEAGYEVGEDFAEPDALLLRSARLQPQDIPASVRAIGRAGAGTNNIPVAEMTKRGVPVFNAPGANANAVKELVLAAMLMSARNLVPSVQYVRALQEDDEATLHKQVEAGKKRFAGVELPRRTLGVIGLGAIGVQVANAALDLGMEVYGYDPAMTIRNAWQLNAGVKRAQSVEEVLSRAQFVSLHVPALDSTHHLINAERLILMRPDAILMNFARPEIVDEAAVLAALDNETLGGYACDFPTAKIKGHPRVIATPHLGASTGEAESNCAVMVADQLRDFLETGNVTNSVNFPEAVMPLHPGVQRLSVVNANVPNMVGQITTALARHQINIADLLNKSRGDVAYTLADVDSALPQQLVDEIAAIPGVLVARAFIGREAQ